MELPDAREKSAFCGQSFCKAVPEQDAGFAPKRYVEDAAARGIFTPMGPDEMQRKMEEHCAAIHTDEVACYCFACDMGLEAGGKDAVHILELVSGMFRE